jgi:hypothetical protein
VRASHRVQTVLLTPAGLGALAALVASLLGGCTPPLVRGERIMSQPDSTTFAAVVPGSRLEYDCTPKIDSEFLGLKINAAPVGKNSHADGAAVIVCAIYRLPSQTCEDVGDVGKAVTVVAVDTLTHLPLASGLTRRRGMDVVPDRPAPRKERVDLSGQFSTGYLNFDVLDFLSLPDRPSTYQVFLTLGEYKSNVVTLDFPPR